VQSVGRAEAERGRRDRRHGIEAGRRELGRLKGHHRHAAYRKAHHHADAQLGHAQGEHVQWAVVGLGDVLDEAQHEHDRHRVVQAGLALEDPRQPPLQARSAQHREDGRTVGGGHNRAQQQALQEREVEQPAGRDAHHPCGDDRAHGGEGEADAQHRPDLRKPRGQAALEEDQGQRHDSDRAGQLHVLDRPAELDQPEAVGAQHHPHEEEEHEARHAQAAGHERGGNTQSQQRSGYENQRAVFDGASLWRPGVRAQPE
jgi:hypothetical protein